MSISHQKVKSVAKVMLPRGQNLQDVILKTVKTASDLVGATLGPGGMSVVIERQETGLPPVVTKDGVTVYKALGFQDPVQQVLMESAREASIRTAAEAGDGTTTATILSEAFISKISDLTRDERAISPQLITRKLTKLFDKSIEPFLKSQSLPCSMDKQRDRLFNVARISANGDSELAQAVMQCFDLIGDEGNVTITEASGASEYIVEKIDGFPVAMGYEESCGAFFPEFINDPATQQCILQKPLWVLNHGIISDFNEIYQIAQNVAVAASDGKCSPYMVVVATGFSETVRAHCASSFKTKGAIRIFPLLAPRTIQKTAQIDFLEDLAALTGAKVFNPLNDPLVGFDTLRDFGMGDGPSSFEIGRFKASVIGFADELLVVDRAEQIDKQLAGASLSELDRQLLKERKAKLTNGIARLIVRGSSNSEVKERRDRAEDAVCAVRSAIKNGALKGGGLIWLDLCHYLGHLETTDPLESKIIRKIVTPALLSPVRRLYTNVGYTDADADAQLKAMAEQNRQYDIMTGTWLAKEDESLLDSYSAVRDALRNSISVANLLGTCGGAIVFGRDSELERREAVEASEYMKAANYNEANERG
jgi:chaperonin GroEL